MNTTWGIIETMAVTIAMTILKMVIKNPSKVKTEQHIVAQIALLATQADTACNGTVWQSTSASS
jgi:hypothetical protein